MRLLTVHSLEITRSALFEQKFSAARPTRSLDTMLLKQSNSLIEYKETQGKKPATLNQSKGAKILELRLQKLKARAKDSAVIITKKVSDH